jgi:hypothetical protein
MRLFTIAMAAFIALVAAQDSAEPSSEAPSSPATPTTISDPQDTTLATLRVPHITNLPYTPAAIYILPQSNGEDCAAILSLAPMNPTQAAIDCSEAQSPVAYATITTRTIGVLCGPCQTLEVVGAAHGCPAETGYPTTTMAVDGTSTSVKWKCMGAGARRV